MKEPKTKALSVKELSVLELIKTLRTIKRQLKLVKGMGLTAEEKALILKAMDKIEQEFQLFKM